ncbi:TonB-dependent receptor [Hyphomonas sp. NPDC076900]|uniref:TonB-dependent receptor n=1 Tax=unclassified Hyphomonas TaxID=2630699 RepID=UPI003D066674
MSVLVVAMPATAQEAGDNEKNAVSRVLQTVTVTATKKADAENIQDVPLSVTAFNSDSIEALKARDLTNLSYSIPNVSMDDVGTTRGTANFAIRGLGINSSIPSIDPAVGVFVDGVYLGINNGVIFDLFDMDSIEVLRGPQGLLFGRNTTGGAVLINTGNPRDEFGYKLKASVETPVDDGRGGPNSTVQGVVTGPIVEGKLNGKLGAYYNTDDGYFKNLYNGDNQGEAQTTILRGALEWLPSDQFTMIGKVEYFNSRSDGPAAQNRGLFERDSFDLALDAPGYSDTESWFATLRTDLDVDFGNGTITNILGYRDFVSTALSDIDSLPFFGFHAGAATNQDQISNELRYSGTFGRAAVTTGVYYFNQDVAYDEVRDLPPLSPLTFYGGGSQDHTVYGIFGQIEYALTDKLTGIFGLRYANEEKDVAVTYIRPRPECSVVDGTCLATGKNPYIPTENNGFTDSDSWSNWTPKVGFQYTPADATQIYGNYTRGFRSGGYNFRITAPAAFEVIFPSDKPRSFDQETVDSYEVGVKHQTQDGRAQINGALFYTSIKDMQRELNLSDPAAGVVQTILNTADAGITGLEIEGRYAFTEHFLVTANIGLIDAQYDKVRFDISGDGQVDAADKALALPRVPETTWGIGFIWDVDLGDRGSLVSRANFQHRDEFAYSDNNFGWIQAADMVDANITWNTPYDGLSVSLYGKNLLDEVTAGGDTQVPFGGPLSNGVNQPFGAYPAAGTFSPLSKGRRIGLEISYEY